MVPKSSSLESLVFILDLLWCHNMAIIIITTICLFHMQLSTIVGI